MSIVSGEWSPMELEGITTLAFFSRIHDSHEEKRKRKEQQLIRKQKRLEARQNGQEKKPRVVKKKTKNAVVNESKTVETSSDPNVQMHHEVLPLETNVTPNVQETPQPDVDVLQKQLVEGTMSLEMCLELLSLIMFTPPLL